MQETDNYHWSSFIKRLIFILIFFTITPLTLFSSILSLIVLSTSTKDNLNQDEQNLITSPKTGVNVFASLPNTYPSFSGQIIADDARPEIIRKYLKKNNSELEPYADFIVQTADKYGLDYRLLTAIGQKESGLGKAMPDNCHNAWGWGIHSQGTLCFQNWEEAIETVSKGLKENYIDKGYISVEQMMKKYAHPSSTTWAQDVLMYMSELE